MSDTYAPLEGHNICCKSQKDALCICNCGFEEIQALRAENEALKAKQALATIPAEALELAKLEREVLEAAISWKNFKGDEYNDLTVPKLYKSVTALEAHKEELQNVSM